MAGVIARDFQTSVNRIAQFQYFLAGKTDGDLADLGYSAAEINTLRSAFADLVKIGRIYMGNDTQATQNDFRQFVRRIFGMGAV